MPTKTRLDPTAGGETSPAGQDGAQGSGRGDTSTSAAAPAGPGGDVAGFIESLTALATHVTQREQLELQSRNEWMRMAVLAAVFVPLLSMMGVFLSAARSGELLLVATFALGVLSAGASSLLFVLIGIRPWRVTPDSVDRVALRHEDSPLRDRIRISQWILFDSVLARFALEQGRARAAYAIGAFSVAVDAAVTEALMVPTAVLSGGRAEALVLGVFVPLVLVSLALSWRHMSLSRSRARHYARQVLALDSDFGGFLPKAEREPIERVARGGKGPGGEAG